MECVQAYIWRLIDALVIPGGSDARLPNAASLRAKASAEVQALCRVTIRLRQTGKRHR